MKNKTFHLALLWIGGILCVPCFLVFITSIFMQTSGSVPILAGLMTIVSALIYSYGDLARLDDEMDEENEKP